MRSIPCIYFLALLLGIHALTASAAVPTLSLPVSVPGSATTTPDKASVVPWLSTDGRYLMVASNATNLIAGFTDNNEASQVGGSSDIYLRDLDTGTYTLVTHAAGSTTAGANSRILGQPKMSDDGRFVVFSSDATDIVTGKGGAQRPYLWDRTTGVNILIADVQSQATGPVISGDGNWIVLCTASLMPKNIYNAGAGNHTATTYTAGYIIDRVSGAVTLMTHVTGNANTAAAASLQSLFISADGGYCAFETTLVSGWDTYTGTFQANSEALYLYNRVADTMTLVTKRNDDAAPAAKITNPSITHFSADGRYIYFLHADVDFGTGSTDSNSLSDVFRYDRDGGLIASAACFMILIP